MSDTIGSFDQRRNRIGLRWSENPCCLRYFQLLERRPSGHHRWQSKYHPPASPGPATRTPRGVGLLAAAVAAAVGWGGMVYAANNSVQGAKKDGGRFRRRRADRDPDRSLQRQRAVREECGRVAGAVQHDEADDRRGRVPRHQAGRDQAHRRVSRQRKCMAQGRRAFGRLDDVRGDPQQDFGGRPVARRHHSERQRRLHDRWRRASPATSASSPRS